MNSSISQKLSTILLSAIIWPTSQLFAQDAPTLISPDHGEVVVGPTPRLEWSSIAGATAYRLCISPPGVQCDTPGSFVLGGLARTSFFPTLPQSIINAGPNLNWSVAACIDTTCSNWQPAFRGIVLASPPDAPSLASPPNNLTVTSTDPVSFSWSSVGGALGYKLCVSKLGVACETGDSWIDGFTDTNAERSIDARFYSEPVVHWTVAACNAAGCTYQQDIRGLNLQIPTPPTGPVAFQVTSVGYRRIPFGAGLSLANQQIAAFIVDVTVDVTSPGVVDLEFSVIDDDWWSRDDVLIIKDLGLFTKPVGTFVLSGSNPFSLKCDGGDIVGIENPGESSGEGAPRIFVRAGGVDSRDPQIRCTGP